MLVSLITLLRRVQIADLSLDQHQTSTPPMALFVWSPIQRRIQVRSLDVLFYLSRPFEIVVKLLDARLTLHFIVFVLNFSQYLVMVLCWP